MLGKLLRSIKKQIELHIKDLPVNTVCEDNMIECLACGWIGRESQLDIQKRTGEDDCIYMDEEVCPVCESVAIEEIENDDNN